VYGKAVAGGLCVSEMRRGGGAFSDHESELVSVQTMQSPDVGDGGYDHGKIPHTAEKMVFGHVFDGQG
jgi:hypothetical protein